MNAPTLIDELLFRRLLLEQLSELNSSMARLVMAVEMVFPPPPGRPYDRKPEDTQIDFANEGPEPPDETEPARKREGVVEAAGSDAF